MKKTILILVALFAVTIANAQSEKRAKIEFEKTTIDLGRFGQEEAVRHCQFIFKSFFY